jgi:hypothetical protein
MKTLRKAGIFIGKLVGLVFGHDFPNPKDLLVKNYPYLAYGC